MKRILFLFILVLISGCEITSNLIKEVEEISEKKIVESNSREIEVYFCPKDECEKELVDFINSANKSVHCGLFDLRLEGVISVLENKSKEIDVKVVVDDHNYEHVESYSFVRKDNSNQLSHNKFCVVDKIGISTGSFNPTERGAYYNNNNLVIAYSKYLAKNFESEFSELWNGEFGKGRNVRYPVVYYNGVKIENYFCPEDFCADRVSDVINNAEESVYFMTFSFTNERIGKYVALKKYEGKEVKGVFEKRNLKDSMYGLLKYQGADVKTDENPYNLHHKVFIIDEKIVVTGSFNPTKSGDMRNDENVLIVYDEMIAGKFVDEFWSVWNFSDELVEEVLEVEDIVISEVYYDAPGKDEGIEYVKLFNPTNESIDVDYWRISDGKNMDVLYGEIKANGSLVVYPKFSLKNSDGIIILKDKGLEQKDYAAYEGVWEIEAKAGEMIKRKSFDNVNDEDGWIVTKAI